MTSETEGEKTSWRELLTGQMTLLRDATPWEEMVFLPNDIDLDEPFDDGYGLPEGKPFIAWSRVRVYFSATYDGSEWVESLPLSPEHAVLGEPTHIREYGI